MPRDSATWFLQSFAKCLAALPNLQCLRILYCSMTANKLQAAFRRQRYSQVQTLVIPANAYHLLQAFPRVTELVVNPFSSRYWHEPHKSLLNTYKIHEAITTYCTCLKLLSTDFMTPHYREHLQVVYGVFSLDHIRSSPVLDFLRLTLQL